MHTSKAWLFLVVAMTGPLCDALEEACKHNRTTRSLGRVWVTGCGAQGVGVGHRVWSTGYGAQGMVGHRVWGTGCGAQGVRHRVWSTGCGAQGVGHRRIGYTHDDGMAIV